MELSSIVKPHASGLNALPDPCVEKDQSAMDLYPPLIVDIQLTGPWHHCSSRYCGRLQQNQFFSVSYQEPAGRYDSSMGWA